jgi:hypothetical protein
MEGSNADAKEPRAETTQTAESFIVNVGWGGVGWGIGAIVVIKLI